MESRKSPARGARWLSGLALLGGLAAPACAQEVSLPEQGIAFTLPDGWTYPAVSYTHLTLPTKRIV